jgi:hypothetical protein
MSVQAISCSRCACHLEPEDLRCPVCALAAPGSASSSTRARAELLRCDTCGAAVKYVVEAQAPRCAFCGSITHVERPEDPVEEADWYVPFGVDPHSAQAALRNWLGSLGFFRPPDLASEASVQSLRPLWWVAWLCDASVLVSWSADSNAGARRSEWAPHAGQHTARFQALLVSASRGLTSEECDALAPKFDIRSAVPQPYGPPGASIERFDVQRSAARQQVAAAIDRTVEHQLRNGIIPGNRFRNLQVASNLRSLVTRRFALPAYVLAYHYNGKLYRAVIHAQNIQCVTGSAPYSLARIALVTAAVIMTLILLGLILGQV